MDLKNTFGQRRALALLGLMALIVLAVLVMAQQPAVAEPPPPLRGPFRFIELPKEASTMEIGTAVLPWTSLYTQTFSDNTIYTDPKWTRRTSTAIYATPSNLKWGRVLVASDYPTLNLTDTLGAWLDPGPGVPADYTVRAGNTYTQLMDAWAIYGPLDTQQWARFQVDFDLYLDTAPGARFGWAASADGTNFCGQALSSHIGKWIHVQSTLLNCPWQTAQPAYLAFFFQSDDSTSDGLGAFVDNVVISGWPWSKTYLPSVKRELTPTPTPSPTPTVQPYPIKWSNDFSDTSATTANWCVTNGSDWAAGTKVLLAGSTDKSYYFRIKSSYDWALSPHEPSDRNYRITAKFGVMGMNSSLNLADYSKSQFGIVFSVYGDPFADGGACQWKGSTTSGGYYRLSFRVKSDGSGFKTRLSRMESSGNGLVEPEEAHAGFIDLPSGVTISRTGWNTLQIDRNTNNNTINIYVNGTRIYADWKPADIRAGGYFGLFVNTEEGSNKDGLFEANWDDITVYNLTP